MGSLLRLKSWASSLFLYEARGESRRSLSVPPWDTGRVDSDPYREISRQIRANARTPGRYTDRAPPQYYVRKRVSYLSPCSGLLVRYGETRPTG